MSGGSLIDVPGIALGHATLGDTGVTVVVAPDGAIAGVDVRGGGPGTRETDLLEPHNTVERVHAITLCGGSAYGLAAADGVMRALEERGIGFPVLGEDAGGPIVPIVPAAVIFDLLVGDAAHRPTAEDGYAATMNALDEQLGLPLAETGSVGAGCGATAGRLRGGFGQTSIRVGDYVVAAGVVANPVGEVVDKRTGRLWGDPDAEPVDLEKLNAVPEFGGRLNTTIGVIATDAPLTKAQAKRLALSGHDGLARAVRPAHGPLDGDTLFAMSTGNGAGVAPPELLGLCAAAADVVQASIIGAVLTASPGYGLTTYRELAP